MTIKKIMICFTFFAIAFMSCSTVTKDDYLLRYKIFIQKVQTEHNRYTESDWLKADRRLNNINSILSKRFKSKLTREDKITMGIYRMRYDYYRYAGAIKGLDYYVDSLLEGDVESIIRSGVNLLPDSIDSFFGEK